MNKKVEGHPHLERTSEGAIVNTNQQKINEARAAKKARKSTIDRLDKLEYDLMEIKDLLRKLVND